MLNDILIYDHTDNDGNKKVISAKSEKMEISDDEKYMELTLYNGNSYIELKIIKIIKIIMKNFIYKNLTRFDLSGFDMKNSELLYKGHYAMLNNNQLKYSIDSLNNILEKETIILNRLSENYKYNINNSLDSSVNISSLNINRIYDIVNKLRILKSFKFKFR